MRDGFAVEDGVALHFRATNLLRVVSSRPDGNAYLVQAGGDGVVETRLRATHLADAGALQPADTSTPLLPAAHPVAA
jgi:hypothetical protein